MLPHGCAGRAQSLVWTSSVTRTYCSIKLGLVNITQDVLVRVYFVDWVFPLIYHKDICCEFLLVSYMADQN